jgi:hypothetical protein
LGRAVATVALASVFVVSFAASFVANGDTKTTRRFVATTASSFLADLFPGKLVVDSIGHIGFNGVDIDRVRVIDTRGRPVIAARGLHVRVPLLRVLEDLVGWNGASHLSLDEIGLDDAEIVLHKSAAGVSIAETFVDFGAPPGPPSAPRPAGEIPFVINLPSIVIQHAHVMGGDGIGETLDVDLAHVPGSLNVLLGGRVTVDVRRSSLRFRSLVPVSPHGTGEYHLIVDEKSACLPWLRDKGPAGLEAPELSGDGSIPCMFGHFDGDLGEVNLSASGTMVDGLLAVRANVPRARPAEIAGIFPAVRIHEPAVLDARLHGRLPTPAFDAELTLGEGQSVDANGRTKFGKGRATYGGNVTLSWPLVLEGDFGLDHLDARAVSPTYPETNVDGTGHATVRLTDEGPDVNVALWSDPFTVTETRVPAARVYAHYQHAALDGSFEAYEPGAALSGRFAVSPSNAVTLSADFAAPSLVAVPRLAGAASGAVAGKVDARLDGDKLDVGFTASGTGVGKSSFVVGGVNVRGRITGPLEALRLDLTADARAIAAGELQSEGARLSLAGSVNGPYQAHVNLTDSRWNQATADASVSFLPVLAVRNLHVGMDSATVKGKAHVASVAVEGGAVALHGVEIDAAGVRSKGSARLAPSSAKIDLTGDIDLVAFGRASLGDEIKAGKAAFVLHIDETGALAKRKADGSMTVEGLVLRHAPMVLAGTGKLAVQGEQVKADLSATSVLEDGTTLAVLSGSGEGSLAGSLTDPATWLAATGRIGVDDLRLDLGTISKRSSLLAATLKGVGVALPALPRLSGELHLAAHVARENRSGPPDFGVDLRTDGLQSVSTADVDTAEARFQTWQDVDARVAVFSTKHPFVQPGADQSTRFGIEVHLVDAKGALLDASLSTQLPADRLRNVLASYLLDAGLPREELAALPLDASFSLGERTFQELPAAVRPDHIRGALAAQADLKGTLGAPSASFVLRTTDVYAEGERTPWPISAVVGGRISEKTYDFTGGLVHDGDEIAQLGATGWLDLEAIALARPGETKPEERWTSSAVLVLRGIQLDTIPGLADQRIAGRLSGAVSVKNLHQNPEINVDLDLLRGAALGGDFASAGFEAHLVQGASSAHLRLEQQGPPGERGGSLDVRATGTLAFRDGLFPRLDAGAPQTAELAFSRFDIAPFATLAQPILGDVGGLLDGSLVGSALVGDGTARVSAVRGEVRWSDGSVVVPQIGQTFSAGSFVLDAVRAKNGEVQIGVRDLSVDGSSGRVRGVASILIPERTLSVWLSEAEHLRPEEESMRVLASVKIVENEKIPVTFEGVALGDGYGAADLLVRVRQDGIDVDVGVPELVFDLPDSFSRKVQDLADPADIALVDKKYATVTRRRRERPVPITIRLGLGDPLADLLAKTPERRGYVTVRRSGLGVNLRGRAEMKIARETETTGTIETLNGRVNALGKPFEVEPGIIRFDGDLTNPVLSLSARWDAPTGVRVYAEAAGNLSDVKLRLRSDPPRPEGDVLSLVLFGRDQQVAATTTGSTDASGSLAVGGGVATTLINSLLEPVQVFGRRLETRVDTSSAMNTKFGVATEIRPNLWAQVDLITASQQTRLQNQDTSSLTLDWRFRPAWSLRTSLGDRGSSVVDLLWNFRYLRERTAARCASTHHAGLGPVARSCCPRVHRWLHIQSSRLAVRGRSHALSGTPPGSRRTAGAGDAGDRRQRTARDAAARRKAPLRPAVFDARLRRRDALRSADVRDAGGHAIRRRARGRARGPGQQAHGAAAVRAGRGVPIGTGFDGRRCGRRRPASSRRALGRFSHRWNERGGVSDRHRVGSADRARRERGRVLRPRRRSRHSGGRSDRACPDGRRHQRRDWFPERSPRRPNLPRAAETSTPPRDRAARETSAARDRKRVPRTPRGHVGRCRFCRPEGARRDVGATPCRSRRVVDSVAWLPERLAGQRRALVERLDELLEDPDVCRHGLAFVGVVAAAQNDDERHPQGPRQRVDASIALAQPGMGQREPPEAIATERIDPRLVEQQLGTERGHLLERRIERLEVAFVVAPIRQRDVQTPAFLRKRIVFLSVNG